MRLMQKKPTKYADIPPQLRTHLAGSRGIANESDWDAKGDQPYELCGPNADHWLNRCVNKIWASTQKGQAHFGPAKAAQRMMQLAPQKMNAVQELAPIVALCLEGDDLHPAELGAEVAEYCAASDAESMMYAVDVEDDWLSAFNCEPSA